MITTWLYSQAYVTLSSNWNHNWMSTGKPHRHFLHVVNGVFITVKFKLQVKIKRNYHSLGLILVLLILQPQLWIIWNRGCWKLKKADGNILPHIYMQFQLQRALVCIYIGNYTHIIAIINSRISSVFLALLTLLIIIVSLSFQLLLRRDFLTWESSLSTCVIYNRMCCFIHMLCTALRHVSTWWYLILWQW